MDELTNAQARYSGGSLARLRAQAMSRLTAHDYDFHRATKSRCSLHFLENPSYSCFSRSKQDENCPNNLLGKKKQGAQLQDKEKHSNKPLNPSPDTHTHARARTHISRKSEEKVSRREIEGQRERERARPRSSESNPDKHLFKEREREGETEAGGGGGG